MALRRHIEIPKSLARLRWAAKIRVCLDPEAILGNVLEGAIVTGAAALGLQSNLEKAFLDVGTVESVDFGQSRGIHERLRLGDLQPFQNVPLIVKSTLRLSRVVLKKMPDAERFFNFLPSNLVLQQLPFVLQLQCVGAGDAETATTHYIFGCWFEDSTTRWDVTSVQDARLIQNTTARATTVVTFDQSVAGNPVVQAASLVGTAALEATGAEESVEDLSI